MRAARNTLLFSLALLLSAVSFAAQANTNGAKRPKPHAVLKGDWVGEATVEQGKLKDRTMGWSLSFGKGDFSDVSGHIINSVAGVRSRKFNLSGPFHMTVKYKVGGTRTFEIMLEARMDPTFSRMTGTFRNIMGNGSFELQKRNCAPPPAQIRGEWKGELAGTKGTYARKTVGVSLDVAAGLEHASATLEDVEIKEVIPSIWDEKARLATFFLKFRKKGKKRDRYLQVTGTFDSSFQTFAGSYRSKQLGTGTLTLKKS